MIGGSGGALAIAGSGSSPSSENSAASGQYAPGKGCGDDNHQHVGSNGQPCPPLQKKHRGSKTHHGSGNGTTTHPPTPGERYGALTRALCQGGAGSLSTMTVEPHLVSHTHNATLRGVAGNIMTMNVRVLSSGDAACAVGTVGTLTLFESSNGQSNSVQFAFPAACKGQDHLYRGPQATEQVP